ncbi:MAG: HlyD family efflux transporter periplasmic adaptor subunit [Nitrospirota bacterium]|nr:HlyD family efflux transporter periplasmic adaptor subunit [Nitrospirota bacterium]
MNGLLERKAPVFLILGALALAVAACSGEGASTPEQADVPVVVDTLSIIAEGRLVPVESVQLSFRSGGEIAEILVAEGDTVEAGQLLARLGNGQQTEAAVASALLEMVSAQQALDALYENADTMAAQAQQDVANAREELRVADYTWSVQQEGNRASESSINGAEANLILARKKLDDAREEYGHVSGRGDSDAGKALAQKNLSNAQRDNDSALRNLNWLTGRPTEIQQAMLDADVAIAQATLAAAENAWEERKDGPDPDEVALAEARVANAEAQLEAAEAALADRELTAPIAGTVASVSIKAGEVATPGQVALVLADFSSWMVETDNLTEIELPSIAVGQPAVVTFDALSDVELAGVVNTISPFFEIKRGDVIYAVEIELNETDPRLQWGMTTVVTFDEVRPPFASR